MSLILNPPTFRTNISNKLAECLCDTNGNHGINLEKGVYNWCIREAMYRKIVRRWDNAVFVQLYIDHLRSIYTNIVSNARIRDMVMTGMATSQSIAFMTHQEMNPGHWEKLISEKSIRDRNKMNPQVEAMTDIFKCRKCKSKQCSFYQLQTRSADEPMTIFVTCIDCGARWKTS
jgi:transcription elongation factor S-II